MFGNPNVVEQEQPVPMNYSAATNLHKKTFLYGNVMTS